MALPTLPDDVLLELFRFLDTRQLLLARGVCRRWRDLALHPYAWDHRSLVVNNADDVPFHIAVLSLAPCLNSMILVDDLLWLRDRAVPAGPSRRMTGLEGRTMRRLRRLCLSTCCAVRSLTLRNDRIDESLARVAQILRNQVELPSSRLRRLRLAIMIPDGPQSSFEVDALNLIKALRGASLLCELRIDFDGGGGLLKWPEAAFLPSEMASSTDVASLKKFEFSRVSTPDPYPFLEFLLRVHADSLEEVNLYVSMAITPVYSLLARCPNLRELTCALYPGVADLAQSPSLVKLSVRYVTGGGKVLQCASNFFRTAIRLTHLAVQFFDTAGPFLRELASSRQSALETLKVKCGRFGADEDWLPLIGPALGGLLELRTIWIEFDAAPVSLLRVITPLTAPRLRRLRMRFLCGCADTSQTYFNGGPMLTSDYVSELLAALRRNPGLHVWGLELQPDACKHPDKGGCWRRWLPNVPLIKGTVGLFDHEEEQQCDLHQDGEVWLRLLQ